MTDNWIEGLGLTELDRELDKTGLIGTIDALTTRVGEKKEWAYRFDLYTWMLDEDTTPIYGCVLLAAAIATDDGNGYETTQTRGIVTATESGQEAPHGTYVFLTDSKIAYALLQMMLAIGPDAAAQMAMSAVCELEGITDTEGKMQRLSAIFALLPGLEL